MKSGMGSKWAWIRDREIGHDRILRDNNKVLKNKV
jgi:hypothetical protein